MAQILISKDRFTVLALPLAGIEVTSDFFFLLFLFFFFLPCWGLHLESLHQSFFMKSFFEIESRKLFAQAGFE
jgi:hypothetical protein